ncbi:MAG: anthranilate synthase component II [Alteromonadaceae bacterium]|nr:anthranilate synthase component II [Alteromonadaceae bacterium]
MSPINIVLLDNYDSFTYNLVDELRALGQSLKVFRNSVDVSVICKELASSPNSLLLLSPGPGNPAQAGCMLRLIEEVQGKYPVLGICLGHQAIVQHYGGNIVRAPEVVHGKSSPVTHCADKMFAELPNPFPVARYHSLMAESVPEPLQVIANYQHIPMAVYHEADQMLGLQFHPESILTSQGSVLLQQSIQFLSKGAK